MSNTASRTDSQAKGQIADDVSKDEMELVRAAVLERLPHQPLAQAPIARPPNMLNSPAAAQAWTAKSQETFDQ